MPNLRMIAVPGGFRAKAAVTEDWLGNMLILFGEAEWQRTQKGKNPLWSMCVKLSSTLLGCSALTQTHSWGKVQFKKAKDQLRAPHAQHSNTTSRMEIRVQAMRCWMQMIILRHLLEDKGGRERKQRKKKGCFFPGAEQIWDVSKGKALPCTIAISLGDWNKKVKSSTSEI